MSRAAEAVTQQIIESLQERITRWQSERAKLEAAISREDGKRARFESLGDLITAAEAEIVGANQRQDQRREAEPAGVRE